MATITREVEFEFDVEDAVGSLSAPDLINAIMHEQGLDVILDELDNVDIIRYLSQYDEHVFIDDDEFHAAAVREVLTNTRLLERVLREAPVSALAEVLENMGGAV